MDLEINIFDSDSCEHCENNQDCPNCWILILRKVIISISTIALIATLVVICRRKQYRLTSIKILILLLSFYIISLSSVLPHGSYMNLNQNSINKINCSNNTFISCLKQNKEVFQLNQAEGVINLASYSMAYWFGVCFIMYIRYQLENKRQVFNYRVKIGTICAFLFTIIWYLIPVFIDFSIIYSPTGYGIGGNDDNYSYLFYTGLVSQQTDEYYLVAIWMLTIPLVFSILALFMHCKIIQIKGRILRQQALTRKQYFLIRLRKFSYVLFIVQITNSSKFLLAESTGSNIAVFLINIFFDLFAFLPIYIYFSHYNPNDPIYEQQASSSILSEEREGSESLVA